MAASLALNHRGGDGKRGDLHPAGKLGAQLAILPADEGRGAVRVCLATAVKGKGVRLHQAALDQLGRQKQDETPHLMFDPPHMEEEPAHKAVLNFGLVRLALHMALRMGLIPGDIRPQPRRNLGRLT
ncbi:MAG: hypothetical protein CMK07_09670 [Ponticaulis sp.]|nr:hypothetical protein [Ponticaulis sp.]